MEQLFKGLPGYRQLSQNILNDMRVHESKFETIQHVGRAAIEGSFLKSHARIAKTTVDAQAELHKVRDNMDQTVDEYAQAMAASITGFEGEQAQLRQWQAQLREYRSEVKLIINDAYAINAVKENLLMTQEAKVRYKTIFDGYLETVPRLAAQIDKAIVRMDALYTDLATEIQQSQSNHVLANEMKVNYGRVNSRYDSAISILNTIDDRRLHGSADKSMCGTDGESPTINDRPCVEIFKLKPPPNIQLARLRTAQAVQQAVATQFKMFGWKAFEWSRAGHCKRIQKDGRDLPGSLNAAQMLTYHYMQPYNVGVNILLAHSAGSGKTCTALLIASIFARANYTPLIVTKQSLIPIYLEEAYNKGCDFNIQQYLRYKGVQRLDEIPEVQTAIADAVGVAEREGQSADALKAIRTKTLVQQGNDILSQMKVHFKPSEFIMTYLKFSNLSRGGLDKDSGTVRFSKTTAASLKKHRESFFPNSNRDDMVGGCIVLVDEAHKLVARATDLTENEQGDYLAIRKLLWNSYEKSGEHSARVVLLTATPVADSPTDLINLVNLLVPQKEAIDLLPPDFVRTTDWATTKGQMEEVYMRDWLTSDGEFKHPNKLDSLCRGRISYFNYAGDGNRFARPQIEWVNVQLTRLQAKSIAQCFRGQTNLLWSKDQKLWIQSSVGDEATKKRKSSSETPPKTWRELIDQVADQPALAGAALKPGKTMKSLTSCVAKSYNWPIVKDDRKPNETDKEYDQRHSSSLVQLIHNVEANKMESSRLLSAYYLAIGVSTSETLNHMKQLIFTDTDSPNYGTMAIVQRLEKEGYIAINKGSVIKSPQERKDIPQYKGMIVLTKRNDNLKELLRMYNARENADGKHVYLLVINGKYKEGISLSQVGYVHIFGYIMNRADLVQAVARTIRNCSAEGLPFKPIKKDNHQEPGWTIQVQIYNPVFGVESGDLVKSQFTPHELLEAINPSGVQMRRSIAAMERFLQTTAYDRILLAPINNLSQSISDRLQIYKPAAI